MSGGVSVWLYEREDPAEIVGFGSLGETLWRYPNPKKSDGITIAVIPFFAVRTRFHGQPPGVDRPQRYAYRIISDLIFQAASHSANYPLLGLCVHASNDRAIRFYRNVGFGTFKENLRMILNLRTETTDEESAP